MDDPVSLPGHRERQKTGDKPNAASFQVHHCWTVPPSRSPSSQGERRPLLPKALLLAMSTPAAGALTPLPAAPAPPAQPAGGAGSTRPQRGPGAQRQPRLSKAARRGLAHSAIKEPNGDFPSPAHIHMPGSGSMPQPEGADGPTAVLVRVVPGNWFNSLLQHAGMELAACPLTASPARIWGRAVSGRSGEDTAGDSHHLAIAVLQQLCCCCRAASPHLTTDCTSHFRWPQEAEAILDF